jgi:hypothetical protein
MIRGSTPRPADHPSPVSVRPARSVGLARPVGRALVAFFVLAYALSWAWMIPLAVSHLVVDRGQGWPTHDPALFGPAVAAVLVVAGTTGRQGIAQLLRRIVLWRVGWRWWLARLPGTSGHTRQPAPTVERLKRQPGSRPVGVMFDVAFCQGDPVVV